MVVRPNFHFCLARMCVLLQRDGQHVLESHLPQACMVWPKMGFENWPIVTLAEATFISRPMATILTWKTSLGWPRTDYGNQTKGSLTVQILYLGPTESPCDSI